MAEIPIRQAKSLCTAAEFELVHWSTSKRVEDLTPARLVAKRDRARKLRDKFRDLANQQKREIRGKGDARRSRPATDNRNTRIKEQMFAETVQRFEAALAEKTAAANAGAVSAAAAVKKSATKKISKKIAKKTTSKASKKTSALKSAAGAAKPAKKAGVSKAIPKKKTSSSKKAATRKTKTIVIGSAKKTRSPGRASDDTQATVASQTALQIISAVATPKTKATMLSKGGNPRIFAHVSSRGRRTQAKRDSR